MSRSSIIESWNDREEADLPGRTISNPLRDDDEDCSLRRGGCLIGDWGAASMFTVRRLRTEKPVEDSHNFHASISQSYTKRVTATLGIRNYS